jgi:dolichol-phosphate mannosyltransferase
MSATAIISHGEADHQRARGFATVKARSLHKLALVIPTLREGENLLLLFDRLLPALDAVDTDYEVLIVDDDSCDGTAEIVNTISREDPRVRLLIRRGQRGLSGAVMHGWKHTDAAIIGVMDADLQHPPELLPELVAAMHSGCDLAIGSRYTAGGELGGWNPLRRLFSNAAVVATWPIQRTGLRARDPMSGFFLVRRDCVAGIPFQQSGFKLLLEILARAHISSLREIPFAFGCRYRGSSKANAKTALEYGRLLARLYRSRFASRRTVGGPTLVEKGN